MTQFWPPKVGQKNDPKPLNFCKKLEKVPPEPKKWSKLPKTPKKPTPRTPGVPEPPEPQKVGKTRGPKRVFGVPGPSKSRENEGGLRGVKNRVSEGVFSQKTAVFCPKTPKKPGLPRGSGTPKKPGFRGGFWPLFDQKLIKKPGLPRGSGTPKKSGKRGGFWPPGPPKSRENEGGFGPPKTGVQRGYFYPKSDHFWPPKKWSRDPNFLSKKLPPKTTFCQKSHPKKREGRR